MTLRTQKFVEKMLARAHYEFDESVKEWVGWINGFPGVYAQGDRIENVRQELAEVLEEYLFLSAQEKRSVPGFELKFPVHAKAN